MMKEELLQLIQSTMQSSNYCIISYINTDGYPVSKAMLMPRKSGGMREFWFSTSTKSSKVKSYEKNSKASLYFVNREQFVGISLCGSMVVSNNKTEKAQIWRDGDELFYPNGKNSNDYVVLKFCAESGQLYAQMQTVNFKIDKEKL